MLLAVLSASKADQFREDGRALSNYLLVSVNFEEFLLLVTQNGVTDGRVIRFNCIHLEYLIIEIYEDDFKFLSLLKETCGADHTCL